ncbi:MAG: amino acid ABC transporter ATP-binding protein, partial [Mesorhizobium sp.]
MSDASNASPALLEVRDVSKAFGPVEVLRSVSLEVARGEV